MWWRVKCRRRLEVGAWFQCRPRCFDAGRAGSITPTRWRGGCARFFGRAGSTACEPGHRSGRPRLAAESGWSASGWRGAVRQRFQVTSASSCWTTFEQPEPPSTRPENCWFGEAPASSCQRSSVFETDLKSLREMRLQNRSRCGHRPQARQLVHIENLVNEGVDRVGHFATMPDPAFRPLGGMQLSLTSEQLDSREDVRLS